MSKRRALTPSELADAARLTAFYKQWKVDRKANGEAGTQDAIADLLGMSQSAFSQYCRGVIPINIDVLTDMHRHLGIDPAEISPNLAGQMTKISEAAGTEFDRDHCLVEMVDAKLSAGAGALVFTKNGDKQLAFRKDFLARAAGSHESVVAFPVTGNSMDQMHIVHGAVVLLDTSSKGRSLVSGKIYGVWIDNEIFIKQLVKKSSGVWCAVSHSATESHPDLEIKTEDSGVIGRAFWVGIKL